jgi:hypothetical protein
VSDRWCWPSGDFYSHVIASVKDITLNFRWAFNTSNNKPFKLCACIQNVISTLSQLSSTHPPFCEVLGLSCLTTAVSVLATGLKLLWSSRWQRAGDAHRILFPQAQIRVLRSWESTAEVHVNYSVFCFKKKTCREGDERGTRSDEKDQRCKCVDTNRRKRMHVKCRYNTYTYPQSSKWMTTLVQSGQGIFDFVQTLTCTPKMHILCAIVYWKLNDIW